MGEDSYLNIWLEKGDKTILLETTIQYHNGEAHEDLMEHYYVPESISFLMMKN